MKKRSATISRSVVVVVAAIFITALVWAYITQEKALNVCQTVFGKLFNHNGYIEIHLIRQHPTDEIFDAELFAYYPAYQNPPDALLISRGALGRFGTSVTTTKLVPFSKGKAFPQPVVLGLPTPGLSHRRFPFDSPLFNFNLSFEPSIQTKVVRFVNRTDGFIPSCDSFRASWNEPGQLTVNALFRRNPFVQTTIVILGFSALAFAVLLSRLRTQESLATSTASYFLSLWSLRGIVDRTILSFPTLLDMWLMGISVLVLLIVIWRSIDIVLLSKRE